MNCAGSTHSTASLKASLDDSLPLKKFFLIIFFRSSTHRQGKIWYTPPLRRESRPPPIPPAYALFLQAVAGEGKKEKEDEDKTIPPAPRATHDALRARALAWQAVPRSAFPATPSRWICPASAASARRDPLRPVCPCPHTRLNPIQQTRSAFACASPLRRITAATRRATSGVLRRLRSAL